MKRFLLLYLVAAALDEGHASPSLDADADADADETTSTRELGGKS